MSDFDYSEGQFLLFQNDKGTNEKRPDYKGGCMINGEVFEIAGWKKIAANGNAYLAGKVQAQRQQAPEQPAVGQRQEPDESIPF